MSSTSSQWIFPLDSLAETPSRISHDVPLSKEMSDRAKGVEFLFRVGVQLQLSLTAMLTAATYFHRFYMRFSMVDVHRNDVAAASLFLATKSEECGRRLKDVAMICITKSSSGQTVKPEDDSPEVLRWQSIILKTEELLLEALCFDFVVHHPHTDLTALFGTVFAEPNSLRENTEDFSWSIATDSFRTPLCVLYPPQTIACACIALALAVNAGPNGASLDDLIGTDQHTQDGIDDLRLLLSRCMEQFQVSGSSVAGASILDQFATNTNDGFIDSLAMLLQFYNSRGHDAREGSVHFLDPIVSISPPITSVPKLYNRPGEPNGTHTTPLLNGIHNGKDVDRQLEHDATPPSPSRTEADR